MLEERALVLNKSWTPISTTSVRRAIVLVVRGAAGIVDPDTYAVQTWSDWIETSDQGEPEGDQGEPDGDQDEPEADEGGADGDLLLQGFGFSVRVPEVIALRHYDGFPVRGVAFTRRNVYRRDAYTCQYCGRRPGVEDLTIDHVIPRSRGGTTCWENCVTACRSCNAKKADCLAHELDLALERAPAAPRWPGGLDPASVRARPAWHRFLPQSTLLFGT